MFEGIQEGEWAWYYEGHSSLVQSSHDDLWWVIEDAVKRSEGNAELVSSIRVGTVCYMHPEDFFDLTTMQILEAQNRLTADNVFQEIAEALYEEMELSSLSSVVSPRETVESFERAVEGKEGQEKFEAISQWIEQYLEIYDDIAVQGVDPFPIYWEDPVSSQSEKAWTISKVNDPPAIITYTVEPSPETGHVGWCWWALGKMGDAKTLKEAMAKAEEVLRKKGICE